MAKKYLDYDGLLYFWQKIKAYFVADVTYTSSSRKIQKTKAGTTSDVVTLATVATSGSYNDLSNKPTIPSGVEKSTTTPIMDGTASVGSETKFAAGDHVHPSDTSRVPTTRTVNGKALSADITLDADDIGIDDFTGATSSVAGTNGLVPAPASGANNKILYGDANWREVNYTDSTGLYGVASKYIGGNNTVIKFFNATASGAGLMSSADKTKLDGIASGAEVNVQSDWNETDTSSDTFILNKPTIPDDKVFVATFMSTSFAEVKSAIDAGKAVVLRVTNPNNFISGLSSNPSYISAAIFYTDSRIEFRFTSRNDEGTITYSCYAYVESTNSWGSGRHSIKADWNATSGMTQILNKPTLGTAAAKGVVTTISSDSVDLPTVTAVKNYVATAITGAAAFQGTAPNPFAPTNYKKGYYWVVGTAGTYAGQVCEPGDMIFAVEDGTTYSASDFTVIQTNLDITSITNAEIDTIVAS